MIRELEEREREVGGEMGGRRAETDREFINSLPPRVRSAV